MTIEGYTGPTSGRITIGAGGEVKRRQTFTDKPLSVEEQRSTEWFTELSPNEQVREARRLKWNADQREQTIIALKKVMAEQDAEILRLRIALAKHTPEGYKMPPIVTDLLRHARGWGWQAAHAWGEPEQGMAGLEVRITKGLYEFRIRWTCDHADLGGGARKARNGLARAPRRDWHDAPSLKKIRQIITEV